MKQIREQLEILRDAALRRADNIDPYEDNGGDVTVDVDLLYALRDLQSDFDELIATVRKIEVAE